MEPVILSCAELSDREINAALAALPDGASARVLEPGAAITSPSA
jgi:hypothetical protein